MWMSLSPTEHRDDADEEQTETRATDGEDDSQTAPDIEEELFEEELRIDGICGVY